MSFFLSNLISLTIMLTLLAVPLIFGLQRLNVIKPSLIQVLIFSAGIGTVLCLLIGNEVNFYFGKFIAIPLLAIGLLVLAASFFMKKRETGVSTTKIKIDNEATTHVGNDHDA